jgi:peptidoglycan L-alanyl-D-glutamate endopeptidase CwlK
MTLRLGANGAKVVALQKQLLKRGFNPGAVDGDFGSGTEAAVLAFQKSEGLLADGAVGPRTAAALAKRKPAPPPSAAGQFTSAIVARMFPHTPLGSIARNLPYVLGALAKAQLADRLMTLMALGTIRAETESFEPVAEGRSRYNTSPNGHAFDLYDNRRDLGNRGQPDGERFCGRGYVQLTGRANYTKYS